MAQLKRFLTLTLFSLPFFANQIPAGELSSSSEVQKNITILRATKNCPKCDLSGANLNRFDLSGANLEGANLSRSTFALADLSNANLHNAELQGAAFTGADLANANLRGADLTGASFVGAYLIGALMDGEMLSTTPYAKDEISDVEESVYVEDTVKPKKPQLTDEITIGRRRDFEETPPTLQSENFKKKSVPEPDVVVPVAAVSVDTDEASVKTLPGQSVAAPAAKAVPAMNEVRLNEDSPVPDSLPLINETKKVQSPEVISGAVAVEKERVDDVVNVDDAIVKKGVVTGTGRMFSEKDGENKTDASDTEEVVMETEDIPVEPESIVMTKAEVNEEDAIQPGTESETALSAESAELTKDPGAESPGVMQTVLSMFSSTEPSTEVLKNVAILLDTKKCYGCNLQGANLSGENLDNVDLEGANLSNAILKDVDLEEANLKGTNLSGADLTGADLSEADMYKADLSGANLTDANLEKALLDDVNFTDVTGYEHQAVLLLDGNQ